METWMTLIFRSFSQPLDINLDWVNAYHVICRLNLNWTLITKDQVCFFVFLSDIFPLLQDIGFIIFLSASENVNTFQTKLSSRKRVKPHAMRCDARPLRADHLIFQHNKRWRQHSRDVATSVLTSRDATATALTKNNGATVTRSVRYMRLVIWNIYWKLQSFLRHYLFTMNDAVRVYGAGNEL